MCPLSSAAPILTHAAVWARPVLDCELGYQRIVTRVCVLNRTRSWVVSALVFTLAGLSSACGDDGDSGPMQPPPDPKIGSVSVTVSTTGVRLDPDGFTVTVDDTLSQTVPANGVVTFSDLAIGRHTVELTGEAINCTIGSANPLTVTVTADVTAQPMLSVECGFLVYVASAFSDDVSVIKAINNTVVATVGVGDRPFRVAITPDGAFAYVTNVGDNTVSVIETADHTVVTTIGVGGGPRNVAISPDGAFGYVVNHDSDDVSVIDIASNTVVATVGVGDRPFDIAITPDGALAYVTIGGRHNVEVIETATNTVVATVESGTVPRGVAIMPNGEFAYVMNNGDNTISVIEVASNTVVVTLNVRHNPAGVAISPDGQFVYVSHSFSDQTPPRLSVISTASNLVVAEVPVTTNPVEGGAHGVAITPDGKFIYVTLSVNNTMAVIETSTDEIIATIGVTDLPFGIAITPF